MTDVVAAIQSAIEIVGRLRALSKQIEDTEFKMLLADLSGELADAKLEVANLKIELAKLKEQHQEQASALSRRDTEKPILCDGAYNLKGIQVYSAPRVMTSKTKSPCHGIAKRIQRHR